MNRPIPWKLYAGTTALVAAVVGAAILLYGGGTEGLLLASRWSARVSFFLFLPSFLASSFARLAPGPGSQRLMAARRHVGLAFAWAHLLHLCVFTSYFVVLGKIPSATALWVGGAGYVAVALMAATSNDAAQRALGRGWRRLHLLSAHVIWAVFTLTYAGFIGSPGHRARGILGVAVCLAAEAVRMAAWRRMRGGMPVPSTASA